MKKTAIFTLVVLLVSLLTCWAESPRRTVTPTSENIFVLKHKKRSVRLSRKESKSITPKDILEVSVIGDTIFLEVPDSVISKYSRHKK